MYCRHWICWRWPARTFTTTFEYGNHGRTPIEPKIIYLGIPLVQYLSSCFLTCKPYVSALGMEITEASTGMYVWESKSPRMGKCSLDNPDGPMRYPCWDLANRFWGLVLLEPLYIIISFCDRTDFWMQLIRINFSH